MKFDDIVACKDCDAVFDFLSSHVEGKIYKKSISPFAEGVVFMSLDSKNVKKVHMFAKHICIDNKECMAGEVKTLELDGEKCFIRTGNLDHENGEAVRSLLPWTKPVCLGLDTSIGLGDRLGLATPGHIMAIEGTGMRPILCQQSIREMTRTERNPDQVMDCATFGVLQEGFRNGFGSDADHLKNTDDIDYCLKAGFTLFTIDPGDHVVNEADEMNAEQIEEALAKLPLAELETSVDDMKKAYANKTIDLGDGLKVEISEEDLLKAAVKYAKAVLHTVKMQRYLEKASKELGAEYELEMSVDETDSPTSPVEHFYVASELLRMGVKPVSLAPRFIGDFEKGVDYQGDLAVFEKEFALHAAIAKHLGPYKISLHSGSDKFSVYPIAAKYTKGLVHVKTAGTSYLEALRAIAKVDPGLFREILSFARENYETDKVSYHVSAVLDKVMNPKDVKDDQLDDALNQFDTRQAFHVTFGSVLTRKNSDGSYLFRDRFYAALENNEDMHYQCLKEHLNKHASPFKK